MWDVDSLKEYVEALLVDRDREVVVARDAVNNRLEGMNQFREQLKEQAGTFITRVEVEAHLSDMERQIAILRDSSNTGSGRQVGVSTTVALGIAILAALTPLLVLLGVVK